MAHAARVTVTLPADALDEIDRFENNRSRFIAEAVAREIVRRRRRGLRSSLKHPHPDTARFADADVGEWAAGIAAAGLVDPSAGQPVHWIEGQGWALEPA